MNKIPVQQILNILTVSIGVTLPSFVLAQESAEIEETEILVVTGERIKRSIYETAASVTVFGEDRLREESAIDRIDQVLDLVPNIQKGSGDIGPTIRGQDSTGVLIGAFSFLGGTRPRATLQIDGRALSYNEFIYGLSPVWDVQQIEVYKGPQTTSQGRNAIAGAIYIETKDPTHEFEGVARAIIGNENTHQASLALSGSLVENQVAARFSLDLREHNSWINYTAPDIFEDVNREDDNYLSARTKLLITPDAIPELEVLLTYTHFNSSNPQGEFVDLPYDERVQNVQSGAHWDTEVDSVILDVDYQLTESMTVNFINTFADSEIERFSRPGLGEALIDNKEHSIESYLQISPINGPIHGIVGASYFNSNQDEVSDLSAFLGFGDFNDEQKSVGVFGEATVDVTPKLHMTLGARWQEDTQTRVGTLGFVSLDYDKTFSEFLPKAEIIYDLQDSVIIGAAARRGYNPGGTTISFATGAIDEFDKETLWTYEMFARSLLADGDIMLSGNFFFTDFTDSQRPQINYITLPDSTSTQYVEFANAPSAESYGFELEGIWTANSLLQIRSSLGFLETEITETLEGNDPLLGREFQRSPKYTATLGLQITPTDQLTLNLNARYNSSYYSDDANTTELEIDSATIIDAKATYDFGVMTAFAYVRNATDETYQVWQLRLEQSFLGDPREYGIGIETYF